MVKPFSIQAPEQVAKEYGGNKQKIAEAAQLGLVDPTAAVLAGMFIDKMRSAQQMEAGQKPTIAQQVLGAPQPQAAPPQGMPPEMGGGLGATPQAMPQEMSAPPEMAMPQEMPPEMGMAEGGIVGLDLPDAMFDEPNNGGYAPGGLVAFAPGGRVSADRIREVLRAQESTGDYGATNTQGSGAMGAYQFMPSTAKALAKRIGLAYRPDLMQGDGGRSEEGRKYQERLMDAQMKDIMSYSSGDPELAAQYHFAGPNKEGHGKKTRKYQTDILTRLGAATERAPATERDPLPERDIFSAEGRSRSLEDDVATSKRLFAGLADSGLGEQEEMYRGLLAPEAQAKARKEDMWMTLAQIGASMAATNSPSFLQAAGAAIASALPAAAEAKKERQQVLKDARTGLREVLGLKRGQQKEVIDFAKDLNVAGMRVEGDQATLKARAEESSADRKSRERIANAEIEARKDAARLAAEAGKSEFEYRVAGRLQQITERLQNGTPVYTPTGQRVGKLSPAEVLVLAQEWAAADEAKGKAPGAAGIEDPDGNGIPGDQRTGNVAPPQAFNPNAYVVK